MYFLAYLAFGLLSMPILVPYLMMRAIAGTEWEPVDTVCAVFFTVVAILAWPLILAGLVVIMLITKLLHPLFVSQFKRVSPK